MFGYDFPAWLEVVVDWRLEGCYNPLPLPIVIHTLGKLLLLLYFMMFMITMIVEDLCLVEYNMVLF